MLTDGLRSFVLDLKKWYRQNWLQWLTAALVFFLISWFYAGSAVQSCNVASPAFNSDTTGGVAWFQWASGNGLSWTSTHKSNYPIGESLNRPQYITSETFDMPYRALAALTSPLCGVNLMILLAYMSTALVMFGLIKWLLRKQTIAYFAGYAAAFVPYYQFKSHSHIIYMFGGVFAGMLWAFLWFVQRPSYKRLGLFALVTAFAMYMDGYFVLIAALLTAGLFGANLLRGTLPIAVKKGLIGISFSYWRFWRNVKQQFRYIVLFGLAVLVLVVPILIVQKIHGADISRTLTMARGNIQIETMEYGARPVEFLLPPLNNPLLPSAYVNWRASATEQHYSNPSENTLYLGITVVVLVVVVLAYSTRRRVRQLVLRDNITYGSLTGILGFCLVITVLFSLEAHFTLHGHVLPAPFDLLLKVTHNWRVPARIFLAIDPLAVTLAALGLYVITKSWRPSRYFGLILLCSVVIFLEYLPTLPLHNGNIVSDTPQVYHQIARDSSVRTIAEYPILAQQYGPSSFTFQQYHHKNLFNANDSATSQSPFSQSIAGLADVQTLGILKTRGVDVVTTFGLNADGLPGLATYRSVDTTDKKLGLPPIYSYKLTADVAPRVVALVAQKGFNTATVDDQQISHHVLSIPGVLQVDRPNGTSAATGNYEIAFDVVPYLAKPARLTLRADNQVVWTDVVTATQNNYIVINTASPNVTITVSSPIDITNLSAHSISYRNN